MNKTLNGIINKFGTEEVVARILEQLRLLADCKDENVLKEAKELINSLSSDTEYIYTLCEYTNLVAYVSENSEITDAPWADEDERQEVIRLG